MALIFRHKIAKVGNSSLSYVKRIGGSRSSKAKSGGCGCVSAIVILLIIGAIFGGSNDTAENPAETAQDTAPVVTEAVPDRSMPDITEQIETEAVTEPPKVVTEPITQPPKAPETEKIPTFALSDYSRKVEAGSNAFMEIKGQPGATYYIKVYYSSGASTAKGLEAKTAPASGVVRWEWKVGPSTDPGTYGITVYDSTDKNAKQTFDFEVYQ